MAPHAMQGWPEKRDWGTKPDTLCEEAQKTYIVYHDSNNIREHSIISVGIDNLNIKKKNITLT